MTPLSTSTSHSRAMDTAPPGSSAAEHDGESKTRWPQLRRPASGRAYRTSLIRQYLDEMSIVAVEGEPAQHRLLDSREAVLADSGIFQGVDRHAVTALMSELQPIDFPRGRRIFTEGEPGERLYIIVDGKVKIGRRCEDGRENLLSILGPSDMFGELSIFDPGPRTSSATTITEVHAASMDRRALKAWIAERPHVTEQLLQVLARRLRRTNDNLADLIFTDVPGRVAKQLMHLAQRFGTQHGEVLHLTHDLTQEEIAQLVGASRETVNKALSDFVHRRWIRLDGKTVLIMDPERLAQRARH